MTKIHNPKSRQKSPDRAEHAAQALEVLKGQGKPCCGICRHLWRPDDNSAFCRRYPPVLKVDGVTATFVPVRLDWLCGEYSAVK